MKGLSRSGWSVAGLKIATSANKRARDMCKFDYRCCLTLCKLLSVGKSRAGEEEEASGGGSLTLLDGCHRLSSDIFIRLTLSVDHLYSLRILEQISAPSLHLQFACGD